MLVTTLTKRMAEDLTDYLDEYGIRVRYLHSDIDTVGGWKLSVTYAWASLTCWWASLAVGGVGYS